jgi:predicted methyltransferase
MKRTTLYTASIISSLLVLGCQPAIEPTPETKQDTQQTASVQNTPSETAVILASMLDNPARSAANKTRDSYRNPVETLEFFGVQPHMTVVEIWPGGGWYSEILAPYLKDNGSFYAAHFPTSETRQGYINSRQRFADRIASDEAFSKVQLTEFAPLEQSAIAPAGSADVVLTFRNVHNWYMGAGEEALAGAFSTFYSALKPGGVLGVVDHRLPEDRPNEDMATSGYVKESLVIRYAEAAGFELVDYSDINANPNDTADHPSGVWTLPPSLRLGDERREEYLAIGESDRFTLKFVKPTTTNE